MGTPDFAKEFLEHIYLKDNFTIKAVYTRPPKKSNRGQKINLSSVHRFAKEKKLEVFCPEKFSNLEIENIKKINPDVIIVVAYGLILPREVLMIPSRGACNIHTSLLPKWRGAAPIQRSIMNGDISTGISIMRMEEGLDEGPTYIHSEIKIGEHDNYEDVYNNLVDVGKNTFDIYFSGHQSYSPVPQNYKLATYAYKIKKSEMQINFKDTAFMTHKKVCAFSPKPGAWFQFNSKKYKVFSTEVVSQNIIKSFENSKKLIFSCKKDYLLIHKIQKEGKKVMKVEDFFRGHPNEFKNIKKEFFKI